MEGSTKSTVCSCEEIGRKTNSSNVELKNRFLEHMRRKHRNSYVVFTDGSKTQEGVGYAFVSENREFSRLISSMTSSFTAKALAIYEALNHAAQNYRKLPKALSRQYIKYTRQTKSFSGFSAGYTIVAG